MEEKKRLVPKPDNLEFPEHFILKAIRSNPIFRNRSWKFLDCNMNLINKIQVPDDKILCDLCNLLLTSVIIDLIIYINEEGEAFIDKAICKGCIDKYHSDLPIINKIECRICPSKIESFRNEISEKEFLISGMCQDCQDMVFENEEEDFEDNFSQHDADRREMDEHFTSFDGDKIE